MVFVSTTPTPITFKRKSDFFNGFYYLCISIVDALTIFRVPREWLLER